MKHFKHVRDIEGFIFADLPSRANGKHRAAFGRHRAGGRHS